MLADMLAEIIVLESVVLRTEKMQGHKRHEVKMAKYYAVRSFKVITAAAESLLGAVAEGDLLRTQMPIFRRLTKHEPADKVALGRTLSIAIVDAGC